MKKALLFVLALAVIPVTVDAQVTSSSACESVPDRPIFFDDSRPFEFETWLLCAEDGDHIAQWVIARAYDDGEGVPEDAAEAVRWYRLAADQGLAQGQYSLGFMYQTGDGVPEDLAEEARWWRLAAEQGYSLAQINLGIAYANCRAPTCGTTSYVRPATVCGPWS